MNKISILMIEDDELSCELITHYLEENGMSVTATHTVTDGVSHASQSHFDLLLLDINLPDFSGMEALKTIQHSRHPIPTIVLSAYSDTPTKLMAFRYGTSDYMVKPLDLQELEARIWVHVRNHTALPPTTTETPLFALKETSIYFRGEPLPLTPIEYAILSLLIRHKNQTLPRTVLLDSLSGVRSDRALDNHIKNIRKKLGKTDKQHTCLRTVYGVGYTLVF